MPHSETQNQLSTTQAQNRGQHRGDLQFLDIHDGIVDRSRDWQGSGQKQALLDFTVSQHLKAHSKPSVITQMITDRLTIRAVFQSDGLFSRRSTHTACSTRDTFAAGFGRLRSSAKSPLCSFSIACDHTNGAHVDNGTPRKGQIKALCMK